MRLAEFTEGRDNNFNLIRTMAAATVLIGHSLVLATGSVRSDPLWQAIGMEIGSVAVDAFFVISGFLVSASLVRRQSVVDFLWSRALRVYPGLWVMLVLSVFVLGACLTNWPARDYYADAGVYRYLTKCAVLVFGVDFYLPGLFVANPYKGAVNGSLWSMPFEIKMYLAMAAVWLALSGFLRQRLVLLSYVVLCTAVSALVFNVFHQSSKAHGVWLSSMFFSGSTFFLWRDRVAMRWSWFGVGVFVLLLTALSGGNRRLFLLVYLLVLPYGLIFLAHVPKGRVRRFNRFGDYSYGLYIYGFPLQQALVALLPGITTMTLIAISLPLVLLLAILSWHGCEKPALGFKDGLVLWTRRFRSR